MSNVRGRESRAFVYPWVLLFVPALFSARLEDNIRAYHPDRLPSEENLGLPVRVASLV